MSNDIEKYVLLKKKNQQKIDQFTYANDGKVDFYPNYIQLEHTNRCNASCIMCNHSYLGNRGCSSIDRRVIEIIKPILPYCSVLMINGDGEPFLTEGIDELLSLYADYGIRIGTNTNLCALTENMIKKYFKLFSFVNISCDGAKEETFEKIRRGLKFNKFLANLELIEQYAPQVKKNMDVVIMRQNIEESVSLVKLAHKYNFKEIRFHRMGVNPCIGNGMDSDALFPRYAFEWMLLAKQEGEKLGISVVIPSFDIKDDIGDIDSQKSYVQSASWDEVDLRLNIAAERYAHLDLKNSYLTQNISMRDLRDSKFHADKMCRWALERIYIDTQGNLSTCCYNVMKKMGNLLDVDSFEELWNGELYREFRLSMNEFILPEWCKTCHWLKEGKF